MIQVAIIGATGYTAAEAAAMLHRHPQATLAVATSRGDAGKPLAEIHRSLTGRTQTRISAFDAQTIAAQCDVAMCCLPHGASAQTVRQLCEAGIRVIDFSADFRLSRLDVYERWYNVEHPWPEKFGQVVYGMPEFFADQIAEADVVANPGCYPTSAILPIAPLIASEMIQADDIIIDSKSGVSGAGRSAKLATLYCETNESIVAYAIGTHRHGPEIDDLVDRISGSAIRSIFTPHLTPMSRGILSTIYVRPNPGIDAEAIASTLRQSYAAAPLVHVVDSPPATGHVAGGNHVHIAANDSGDRVVLTCAIDNLAKGASGAAIQNMNVMFGLDQSMGLN